MTRLRTWIRLSKVMATINHVLVLKYALEHSIINSL